MDLLSVSQFDWSQINWSRAQFAMTAMYHWLFVPLTLGLGVIMALMETMYVRTGDKQWKRTAKFWMVLFGINFAIGIATGLILEFQFGTNWSNYSWFVGDIFGAPLAIEGILAFFLEATFISIMFFGWTRVSKRAHLTATWLTVIGATLSALWILIANAWMQYPVGMEFNPDISRNEMVDFWAVALSPMAVNKFLHTVISSWILGSVFAIGIASWYLLKKRHTAFANQTLKVSITLGLIGVVLTAWTGHGSAVQVAEKQPMKLAIMEGMYEGGEGAPLVLFGVPNPSKKSYNDGVDAFLFPPLVMPKALSLIAFYDTDAYVPGITDIIEGGYKKPDGTIALSFEERKAQGKLAFDALDDYKEAKANNDEVLAAEHLKVLEANFSNFGYSYFETPDRLVQHTGLVYWSFHIMVYLAGFFILLFILMAFFMYKKKLANTKWLLWLGIISIPLVYICSEAGWIVAEVGRQPWTIQDLLPAEAAVSSVSTTSVMISFFVFLTIFTGLLIAEMKIMLFQIKKGPEEIDGVNN